MLQVVVGRAEDNDQASFFARIPSTAKLRFVGVAKLDGIVKTEQLKAVHADCRQQLFLEHEPIRIGDEREPVRGRLKMPQNIVPPVGHIFAVTPSESLNRLSVEIPASLFGP